MGEHGEASDSALSLRHPQSNASSGSEGIPDSASGSTQQHLPTNPQRNLPILKLCTRRPELFRTSRPDYEDHTRLGQWIEKQSGESNSSSWAKMFSQQKGLPVEQGGKKSEGKDGQKTPIRQQQWGVKGGEMERFVVEDKNVATHLVRNALGGKDKDMVCALLTLPAPY